MPTSNIIPYHGSETNEHTNQQLSFYSTTLVTVEGILSTCSTTLQLLTTCYMYIIFFLFYYYQTLLYTMYYVQCVCIFYHMQYILYILMVDTRCMYVDGTCMYRSNSSIYFFTYSWIPYQDGLGCTTIISELRTLQNF